MRIEEFISYIESIENKKIEEICKDLEDQTILWINSGKTHKYELLVWDSDYKEVLIRLTDKIMKDHPKAKWVI
jgi:hypothetical protein